MRRLAFLSLTSAALVLAGFAATFDGAEAHRGPAGGLEVWAVDHSNTTGTTHGGTLYVYRGSELKGSAIGEAGTR